MDKRHARLVREYTEARHAYPQARNRLLEYLQKMRRIHRARQPKPIELPGYETD